MVAPVEISHVMVSQLVQIPVKDPFLKEPNGKVNFSDYFY